VHTQGGCASQFTSIYTKTCWASRQLGKSHFKQDFRLVAVSVQSLMCHIRGSNSLTCGSTNIELFCTWGTPEKLPPTVNSCQREAPSARRLVPIGARAERAAVFPPPTAGKPLDETRPNDAISGQEPKRHTGGNGAPCVPRAQPVPPPDTGRPS
jgi:hypothetical protein